MGEKTLTADLLIFFLLRYRYCWSEANEKEN